MYFLSTFCAVCLTGRREVQNINNKDTDDISLVEKLKYCSFKTAWMDDTLPLFICYKCYNELKIAYSFKKMCASNSTILKRYVSRLKYGDSSVDDREYRQLRVEIEKEKIYGVNILLYERVEVEEVDMDVSSSEEDTASFEDTAIDIKEESIQVKAENSEQEDVEQNQHLDKAKEIQEESEADICFVEVKDENNVNLSPEPEHILPDIHYVTDLGTNLTVAKHNSSTKASTGGGVNLLNIINDQISHFLTTDNNKSHADSSSEVSTLRSLLEASKVAQSHVMQSLNSNKRSEQVIDDIECISSDSDSTQSQSSKSVSRRKTKRKLNVNTSLPLNVTTLPPQCLTNIRPEQFINNAVAAQEPTQPLVTQSCSTTNYLQPTNTFLIIYDDINPPAAPLVTSTKTTSGFILGKDGLIPNTEPYNSQLTVPGASAAPLLISPDTSNSYVLPTSTQESFTYANANSHFVQQTSVQGCSYVLPTATEQISPDSELSDRITACPVCKKTFTKNKYLKQHFETHYSVTHKCNVCEMNFVNEKMLKTHVLLHKGGQNYKCDYCCQTFAKLSSFKKHSSLHVGVKQFECSVCEKRFVKRSSLTKHLAAHNDGKTRKCTMCKQVFQYKCRLEKHMLTQHPNK